MHGSISLKRKWRRWNNRDDATLRADYRRTALRDLAVRLNHSPNAVKIRARSLGLTDKAPDRWTKKQIAFLCVNYGDISIKKLAANLGKSKVAIRCKAAKLGLEKSLKGRYDSIADSRDAGCPKVRELTTLERGYVAGLLDGEGCITASISHGCHVVMQVGIANTNRGLIEWLVSKLGSVVQKAAPEGMRKKAIYWWALRSGRSIQEFLSEIAPLLIIKKRQAELALTWRPFMDPASCRRLARLIQALNH